MFQGKSNSKCKDNSVRVFGLSEELFSVVSVECLKENNGDDVRRLGMDQFI